MLKQLNILAIAFIAILNSPINFAHEYEVGQIHIDHPWSREAPPNSPVIGGFLQLNNHGDIEDSLIAAESPISGRIELHNHIMEDGVMKMVKVDEILVPENSTVALEPGSFHLMVFNPTQVLHKGDRFPMTLIFKHAGKIEVEMAVEDKGHMQKHMSH